MGKKRRKTNVRTGQATEKKFCHLSMGSLENGFYGLERAKSIN